MIQSVLLLRVLLLSLLTEEREHFWIVHLEFFLQDGQALADGCCGDGVLVVHVVLQNAVMAYEIVFHRSSRVVLPWGPCIEIDNRVG